MTEENDIITINSFEQIKEKLIADGDLREGEDWDDSEALEVLPDDDLGFYQLSCSYLISQIMSRLDKLEAIQDKLEEVEAVTQVCEKDHMYIAKSKEYPCPLCIINKILKNEK
jgi:hypothetical protein